MCRDLICSFEPRTLEIYGRFLICTQVQSPGFKISQITYFLLVFLSVRICPMIICTPFSFSWSAFASKSGPAWYRPFCSFMANFRVLRYSTKPICRTYNIFSIDNIDFKKCTFLTNSNLMLTPFRQCNKFLGFQIRNQLVFL